MGKFQFGDYVVTQPPELTQKKRIDHDPSAWLVKYPNHSNVPYAPKPQQVASFCMVATARMVSEFQITMFSLRMFHDEPVYVSGDAVIGDAIRKAGWKNVYFFEETAEQQLQEISRRYFSEPYNVRWKNVTGKFHNPACILKKMDILSLALKENPNAVCIDADLIFTKKIEDNVEGVDVILSPHYDETDSSYLFGEYNAGLLCTSNKDFAAWWCEAYLNKSDFYEQECLKLVFDQYKSVKKFDPTHNYGNWRNRAYGLTKKCNTPIEEVLEILGITVDADIFLGGKQMHSYHSHMKTHNPMGHTLERVILHTLKTSTKSEHKDIHQFITQGFKAVEPHITLPRKLAVISCFFSPNKYKRPYDNCIRFMDTLEKQGVPYYLVELAVGNEPHVLPNKPNIIKVRSNSTMFQKERLLNIALTHLPADYDKVAWVDADIEFTNPNWASLVSDALEHYVIIQPFSRALWLDRQHKTTSVKESLAKVVSDTSQVGFLRGWGGFAWAARRETLDVTGFFDKCVTGHGDTAIALAAYGWEQDWFFTNFSADYIEQFMEWYSPFFENVRGNVGYVDQEIKHYWHGNIYNRDYVNLYKVSNGFNPTMHITLNQYGVYEWTTPNNHIQLMMSQYFKNRHEDGEDYVEQSIHAMLSDYPASGAEEGDWLVATIKKNNWKNIVTIAKELVPTGVYVTYALKDTALAHLIQLSGDNDMIHAVLTRTGLVNNALLRTMPLPYNTVLARLSNTHSELDALIIDGEAFCDVNQPADAAKLLKTGGSLIVKNITKSTFKQNSSLFDNYSCMHELMWCKKKMA